MKYVNADRVTSMMDDIINRTKRRFSPNPEGTAREVLADGWIKVLELLKASIDEMAEELPTPSGIEDEH